MESAKMYTFHNISSCDPESFVKPCNIPVLSSHWLHEFILFCANTFLTFLKYWFSHYTFRLTAQYEAILKSGQVIAALSNFSLYNSLLSGSQRQIQGYVYTAFLHFLFRDMFKLKNWVLHQFYIFFFFLV